ANNQLVNQTVAGDQNYQLYYRAGELVNQVLVEEDKKVRWIKSGATCLAVNDDQDVILTANGQNESLLWSVKNSDSQGELHQYGAYGQGEAEEYLPAYNGERKDPISGHYHLGNGYRSYSPVLMRFTCPDSMSPFGEGGINAYAYCAGDPINLIDPSGHSAMGTAGLFSGGVIAQGLGRLGAGGGIALGIIGIVSAVATFGASAAAMGVAMASISLTLSLAAEATGIASIAVGNSDPELSANLGWASLGLGIAGSATGVYSKPKTGAYNVSSKQNILSDSFTEGFLNVESKTSEIKWQGREFELHIVSPKLENQKKLDTVVLFAHGGPLQKDTFRSSSRVGFYAKRGKLLWISIPQILRGERNLGVIRDSYRANRRIPNQLITPPYLPAQDPETGMGYLSNKEVALDTIRKDMNKNKEGFPYAVALSGTDEPVPLDIVVEELQKKYKNVYVACCRKKRRA
ncbi:RHS repeat-associated core domain-containing protein, partial [Myroides sp. TSA_177.3]|uniref:RHS repeat-associated core domain-containing protein n=1 Tax=Myroides sp. TSA_177.3 TaxID=3415650 RepID=UPI004045755F